MKEYKLASKLFPRSNFPIYISVLALILSMITFYVANVKKEQSLWVFLSQHWIENEIISLQIVISNDGNRQAIVPSILVHGNIPGQGTFLIEALKAPLILSPKSSTSFLLEIPTDLSERIVVRHSVQDQFGNFLIEVVALYSDKQHYAVTLDCSETTFASSKIGKFDYPRYIKDLKPVQKTELSN